MNNDLKVYKVLQLPTEGEPNSIYYLLNGDGDAASQYITNTAGEFIPTSDGTSTTIDTSNFIEKDGSKDFTSDQSMGGNKLINVDTPVNGTDAVNKDYVDSAIAAIPPSSGSNFIDSTNSLIRTQGSDKYILGDQQPYPSFVYRHNASSFRADAAAAIRINGTQETILSAFNRFGTGSGDSDPVTLWASWSYDGGRTWGTAFEFVPAEALVSNEIPQFYYRNPTTLVCLYYKYTSSTSFLMGMESTDGGITWTTPVVKFSFNTINTEGLADPMSNRVFQLSNGTWVLPMGIHIVGSPSGGATGYYDGRLLYSINGVNWYDTNLNITASDNMVGEPGVFEYNEELYYYWRTRSNTIFYVTISDLVTFASTSAQQDLHLDAPNSTSTVIYDETTDRFYALHNPIFKRPIPLEPYPRIYMMLSSSSDLNSWEQVHQVDYKDQQHFFEPTLIKLDDFFLIFYSDGEYFSPDYKHNLKCLRMPIVGIQQYRTQQHKLIDIRAYKDWWNDAGLLGRQAKYLHIGNRDVFRGDGYFEVNGNSNLNYTSFAPVFDIQTYGTDRAVEWYIRANVDPNAEPFQRFTYLDGGVAPTSNILLEEHIGTGGSVVYKKWADAKWYNKFLDDSSGVDKQVLVNNGIVKLGGVPGGGGGGGNTIYTADDTLTGSRTITGAGNHITWDGVPYQLHANNGSITQFLKVSNAAPDNKVWGLVNDNGTFIIRDYSDALSGVQDFMTLVKGSNEFTVGTRFIKMVANQPYVSFVNTGGGGSGLYWGAASAYAGVSNAGDGIVVGDVAGDMSFRISSKKFVWSVDGGATAAMKLKSSGLLNIANVPDYADNAAALAATLTVGDVYRTGDFLKIVH